MLVNDLWRGLNGVTLSEDSDFVKDKGGTDYAPQSTSTDLKVALKYSKVYEEGATPVLLRIRTKHWLRQAVSLRYLSCFPAENERLYPPLTHLEYKDHRAFTLTLSEGRTVSITVVKVEPEYPSS